MKQESAKKTPKWLLPVIIAAAVLVIAGVVLAIVLGGVGQQGPAAVNGPYELYWNVDREVNVDLETGLSLRQPDANGKYKIRFAVGGQQVDLYCADKKLVNVIDYMDLMALIFDANGDIVDVKDPKDVATVVVKDNYVKSFDGTTLTVNSTMTMNGMEKKFTITEDIGIYNVDADACEMVGEKYIALDLMDKLSIYADAEGNITHIFVTNRAFETDVYYRFERFSGVDGHTTRKPDENGVYTIGFVHKGEKVYLKCKDATLVDVIDLAYYEGKMMGLYFDEEGYIIDMVSAAEAIRGKLLYDKYTVIAIDGNNISMECRHYQAPDIGKSAQFVLNEDCEIYNLYPYSMPDEDAFEGHKVDSLKVGDRIYVWTDMDDNAVMVFIDQRKMDNTKMYTVLNRSYDWEKGETTRPKDENGYYVYDMICEGKQLKLRTKNKVLANRIDSADFDMVGLELKGDIIMNATIATGIFGGGVYNSYWVNSLSGPVCQLADTADMTKLSNLVLTADFMACDFSGAYGTTLGEKTKLRVGDRIIGFTNESGELAYVKILDRYEEGSKLYFNNSRNFNWDTEETGRVPNEDGYYILDMTCDGKPVQLKTKDKDMVSYIDRPSNLVLALKVSNGIIKGAYNKDNSAFKFCRIRLNGAVYLKTEKDNTLTFVHGSEGTYKLTKDTQIYGANMVSIRIGEKTKLQENDSVRCYVIGEEEYVAILVTFSRVDSPLYWNTNRMRDFSTGETTRVPNAEGYYVYELAVDGKVKTFKTKDKALANELDSYSHAFGLMTDGDIIIAAYSIANNVIKDYVNCSEGWGYNVLSIKGNKMTLVNNAADAIGTEDYGKIVEVTLAKNYKAYNICKYAGAIGAETKLAVGDRVAIYANRDGEVNHCVVMEKATRKVGVSGYCEHCDKEVWWQPLQGSFADADMHYYLPNDLTLSRQVRIGWPQSRLEADPTLEQYEIVLDLNGHTITANSDLVFEVNGTTLSILDSAQGGRVAGGAYSERLGGAIAIYQSGTLNIYGGSVVGTIDETPLSRGGAIHAGGSGGTINLYDGAIIGGYATEGGAMTLGTYSTFNMYGGTVTGGKGGYGGNIFGWGDAKVNLYAGVISSGNTEARGGNIRLYHDGGRPQLLIEKDAKVIDGITGKTGGNIYLDGANAVINGTVSGGAATEGSDLYIAGNSTVTLNAKLETVSRTGESIFVSGDIEKPATLNINNVSVAGCIRAGADANLVLAGKVEIPAGLKLTKKDTVIDITNLTADSSIVITAQGGVFTTQRDDIADFLPVFTSANEEESVVLEGNALSYTIRIPTVEEMKAAVDAWVADVETNATFAAGGEVHAYCPVCKDEATWIPLSGEQSEKNFMRTDKFGTTQLHAYLADNVSYAGENHIDVNWGAGEQTCLYLNGKTFTSTKSLKMSGTTNIIGGTEGKIVRPETAAGKMFWLIDSSVSANIYGGTYEDATAEGMFFFDYSNKIYNLYGGTYKAVKNFVIAPSNGGATIMNIEGAEISVSGGPAFNLNRHCTVNMNSGTVTYTGETAVEEIGGLVQINRKEVSFTINGGTISGGKALTNGGNVYLAPNATLTMNGGQILGGTAGTRGGNIYADYGAVINMTGDAVIADGTCSNSHNIWLEGATLNMRGDAKIVDTHNDGYTVNGWYYNSEFLQKVTLADNASIVAHPDAVTTSTTSLLRIYNSGSAADTLEIAEGWAGEVYFYHNVDLAPGDAMAADRIIALGDFTGKLYHRGCEVKYVEGALVIMELPATE